jgi:PAS domain S-box-containing protein
MIQSLHLADPAGFHSALLQAWFSIEDECVSIWEKDTLDLVYINPSGCKIFGYDNPEEMRNNHRFFCFSLETMNREELDTAIRSSLESHGQWEGEGSLCRKNGEIFHGKVNVVVFSFEEKLFLLKRVIDVEDRRQMELKMMRQNQRFEALFHFASIAIMVINQLGGIVLANNHAMQLFGYTEETIAGMKIEDLMPERFRSRHVGQREHYQQDPQYRPMGTGLDLFARKSDGKEFPVEISLGHFQTEEGRFVIAFVIDITHRKQIERAMLEQQKVMERVNQEIEQLNDELEEKVEHRTRQLKDTMEELERSRDELEHALSKEKELSDLKTRFVSMASHEFRTPLSTILSSASLVAKYTQSEEQNKRDKHIQRIRSAVSNLTDILNEFLSIGRIEEGRIQANLSTFNIKEQVQLVCSEMQSILKPGQHIRIRHSGPVLVNQDLSLLRNVLINLISNASKFSSETSPVDVATSVGEKEILVSIRDYGIGISEDDKKHLFERFFRGNNVTNIQGTGLGLHIVSKYVELMNGSIEVESELEKGTTFLIRFAI